jgi:hypothetical protein
MSNRIIFISCGQYSPEERRLGRAIVQLVDRIPGMKAYFADEVQDLKGLDSNILTKLRECAGFITVMHPRGKISRPDGSELVRASVWIEQEIAIATYINEVEKRRLPVIAFRHSLVGLEGLRGLIQLNPIEFTDDMEILAQLPHLLEPWKSLPPSADIRLDVNSTMPVRQQDGHEIRQLVFTLVNDSNSRIREFSGEIKIPQGLLKHSSPNYGWRNEISADGRTRVIRFNEKNVGEIEPHTTKRINAFDYCKECAIGDTRGPAEFVGRLLVDDYVVSATVWIEEKPYPIEKTMKQLLEHT